MKKRKKQQEKNDDPTPLKEGKEEKRVASRTKKRK
jgi:hypothetical protein